MKCIVKGCNNHSNQGVFIDKMCSPCHEMITTGEIGPTDSFLGDMKNEINRLKEKCDLQATILRHLTPEKFPDTLFIHSVLGKRDQNNMPEKLMIVPAYGVDFSYIYERTNKTIGPEW